MRRSATIHGDRETPTGRASQPAFTLVELLVVTVLLGLLATTATLWLHGMTEHARLRGATLRIEQALRLARHQTMKSHQPAWLQFKPGGNQYRLVFVGPDGAQDSPWQEMSGVTVERAVLRHAERTSTTPDTPGRSKVFTVGLTPSGATLPWALELRAGSLRRVVWTDGVSGRLAFRDRTGLDELDWARVEGGTLP